MANKKSSKKALRQDKKRKLINQIRKTEMKTSIKSVREALITNKPKFEIMELLNNCKSKLQRAASKKVIHKNTASRKISRISIKIENHFSESK